MMTTLRTTVASAAVLCAAAGALEAQGPSPTRPTVEVPRVDDSVTIRVVNTDLRTAVQLIGQYLDRPVIFSGSATTTPVTLETPKPVPRRDVVRLLRSLVESQAYELVDDTSATAYRVRPRETQRPPANPLQTANGYTPNVQQPVSPGQARQTAAPELFFIGLHHARATDVASTLNSLFGKTSGLGGGGGPGGNRPSTLAEDLRNDQIAPVGAPPPQAIPGIAGRSAALSGDVTIVPDARANSLLVRANRQDFALISAAVQQIDVRPLQVLIEVLIVETQKNNSFQLGLDAALSKQQLGHSNTSITSSVSSGGQTGDLTVGLTGIAGLDLDATISAAADRGEVHIVSRPVVLAANNEKAEVVVGSQRPFVQLSRTLPTDNAAQDQIVQYKDVGTKLTVTPTISGDGLVQLDVLQEVSNATSETAFNAPVISNRSIRTQLLVRDSQTVVLGGLRDHEKDTDQGGVPVLSSIPFIGGLFGHASRTTTETELFIFITPRVIRGDDDAATLTDPLRKRANDKDP